AGAAEAAPPKIAEPVLRALARAVGEPLPARAVERERPEVRPGVDEEPRAVFRPAHAVDRRKHVARMVVFAIDEVGLQRGGEIGALGRRDVDRPVVLAVELRDARAGRIAGVEEARLGREPLARTV